MRTNALCHFFVLLACVIGLFSLPDISHAQERTKPKLVEITLNEETNNPQAEKIIRKIYEDWARQNNEDTNVGAIQARFLPLARTGSSHQFIFGTLYDLPYGGCFIRGCKTVILHSKGDNQWTGVFRAFVHSSWYDENSKQDNHANLIFTSNTRQSNPGVWMWNGTGYQLVNK